MLLNKNFLDKVRINFILIILCLFTAGISGTTLEDEPLAIFLTWKEDPTTSMCIDWHTLEKQNQKLYYKEKDIGEWQEAKSKTHPFPFSDRYIHRVALQDLKPGTSYDFKFQENSKEYYFNTMPSNTIEEPVIIAFGGDTMLQIEDMEKTNHQVVKYNPHFVVIGGDLAYTNGKPRAVQRWYDWFEAWKNSLITKDNRVIPIVLAIGNHEVVGNYYFTHDNFKATDKDRETIAPYFYKFFAFPGQPGYNTLDFGNYLSLIILDSDHTNPIDGAQTEWLSEQLKSRRDMFHTIPVYHVPAYPSSRNFNGKIPQRIREFWVPLFEEHGVKIAFENHDHAYKRTYPIKNNKIDEDGIVFIGDGAWGRIPRKVHNVDETWYLKSADSVRHFTIMSIQGRNQSMLMINDEGELIDSYPSIPPIKRVGNIIKEF